MKKIYISAILLGVGVCPEVMLAQEQPKDSTLNRTITVENEYNPQLMDAFKVNVLPKVEEPAVTRKHIDYEETAHPFTRWQAMPMKSLSADADEQQPNVPRGYVRAVYGNRNNMDVKASYLWDMTSRDRLEVMASCYGMNGKVYHPNGAGFPDWKSRFYRTDASLDYCHQFNKVALSLGGSFASQVFSYMPGDIADNSFMGRQHYTLGDGYVGFSSVEDELPVHFSVQTGFRTFNRKYAVSGLDKGVETVVHTLGEVSGEVNDEQRVGIAFAMDNVMYGNQWKDYTLLQVNPYYTLKSDEIHLRLGAHVDWQMANGSGVKVAPDVEFAYTFAGSYVGYIQAMGGTRLNDYRGLNALSPFWMGGLQMKSTYTPMDLQAGLKASPLPGLGIRVYGGYRIVKDEVFLLPAASEMESSFCYVGLDQKKAQVGYGGAEVSYGFKDRFDFSLAGIYQSWSMDAMWKPLLWLKPEFSLDCSVRAKVFADLTLSAQYRYESRVKVGNLPKADAVNELTVGAGYEFFHRLNVFVDAHNLLNQEYLMENAYPVQGFHVMAGASFRF